MLVVLRDEGWDFSERSLHRLRNKHGLQLRGGNGAIAAAVARLPPAATTSTISDQVEPLLESFSNSLTTDRLPILRNLLSLMSQVQR